MPDLTQQLAEGKRPRLLDLFCGAGGATKGYQRAGFYVVGVDIEPQPNYCGDEFVQADAVEVLDRMMAGEESLRAPWVDAADVDAIHASPPCQNDTAYRRRPAHVRSVARLIEPVRERLEALGKPYIIENVPGAPLHNPVRLCGSSFGLDVRRHRLFESNIALLVPPCDHGWQTPRFPQATNRANLRRTVEVGVWRIPLDVQQRAMGIDWMTREELSQAIPPNYAKYLGWQLIGRLGQERAA